MKNCRTVTTLCSCLLLCNACSSSEPVQVEQKPLTATELTSQGNEICREMKQELLRLSNGAKSQADLTLEQMRQRNAARTEYREKLFSLNPPAEFQADFNKLSEVGREWDSVATSRVPEPDINQRLGPQWRQAATKLGLTDCI